MLELGDYIYTINLINQRGLKQAAEAEKITYKGMLKRVKALEKKIGIKFYPDYTFDRMTYQGQEWLNRHSS